MWKDFINSFARALGITSDHSLPMVDLIQYAPNNLPPGMDASIRCLKLVLASTTNTNMQMQSQDEGVVTMEYFGKVLAWFGNLKQDGVGILDKIKEVLSEAWFHGDISMQESTAILTGKEEGTYLVRFSTSELGTYTISKVSHGSISHLRLQRTKLGKHAINGHSYDTIGELIKHEMTALGLQVPCPGSRFTGGPQSGYLN